MTVTPKQLREAADTLDAFCSESGASYFSRQLREAAEERSCPVGTVRQAFGTLATYTKVGEDRWVGVYPSGINNKVVSDLSDAVVGYFPIVHRPS